MLDPKLKCGRPPNDLASLEAKVGVPAAQGGVFTVMLPVSAALVGVCVLGETLTGIQTLALGIALASVLLATLPPRKTASPASAQQ